LFGLLVLAIGAGVLFGQGGSGTINGTVYDQSGSIVPNAQITLTREGTGDIRRMQSNADGFFAFVALPVGTYAIEITYEGFNKWAQKSIQLTANDKYGVSNIRLTPKSITQTVEVTAASEVAVPVTSIEKSSVINSKTIQNVSIIGRNAVEMLKILPGVAVPETDNYEVASFGSGGIGTVHVTGIRSDATAISVDGANTIDVGNNGGSSVTPNVEMVQEVKVETAAMSAENARGPVSVSAVSKSGTNEFHGEAYTYLRNYHLNSQDWQANRYGFDKPKSKFVYPGFNIGGPVIIPGTDFNRNRDKLFFFAGFEWSRQDVDLGIDSNKTWVPTQLMRQGDFSELAGGNYPLSGYDTNGLPANGTINGVQYFDANGKILNKNLIDPGGQVMMNMYPLPNRNPANSNGYNYISQLIEPQNRNQQLVRLDYSISDRTKIYTRFNHEGEVQFWPYCLWWNNGNQVPSPTPVTGGLRSYSSSTNLVQVLNPTTTNEVMFSATWYNLPFNYDDVSKMSRKALGYPYKGMFGNTDVIPNITDWGGGVATMYQPGGFPRDATKWTIGLDDNFSKVIGTHSLKFGAHYEYITNTEPTSNSDMGTLTPTNWGGYSTGNAYADLLVGYIGSYAENNKNFLMSMRQREFSFYVQDSWKASRRLTLELGARFYHLGQMYNVDGLIAGFDPKQYKQSAPTTDFTGVVAEYRGSNVDRSIWTTPTLNVAPRIGFAYDVTGKGVTVVRGGFGMFVYRDQANAAMGATGNPPTVVNSSIGWGAGSLAGIDKIDPKTNLPKSSLQVLEIGDNKLPMTYNWNLTVSRRLPKGVVAEVSYVGNRSVNQVTPRASYNLNAVPLGAEFGFPKGTNNDDYRPLTQYLDIAVRAHVLSQSYNSMQLTLNRQVGRFNFSFAYTFSKAIGVGGDYYSGGGGEVDPFDWNSHNHAPLDFDRTNVVSIAYVYSVPDSAKNKWLGGFVNGWQVSGITQMQSGGPLSFTSGGTQGRLSVTGTMAKAMMYNPDGSVFNSSDQINGTNIDGSPQRNGRPLMTCDPGSNLAAGSYINPNCFAAPLPHQNGTFAIPYVHGPAFQNHDLSAFKNFALTSDGKQKIQFRFNAYNFMNHPNAFFTLAGASDPNLVLNYNQGKLLANPNFGIPNDKRGKRILQLAIKYIF
jgi:hypothetical protein